MTCDWTKENVVLYIYGELADDAKFEYEQHVRHCLGCRRELEAGTCIQRRHGRGAGKRSFTQLSGGQQNAVAGSAGARGAVAQYLQFVHL